jgi:hypothetical protein
MARMTPAEAAAVNVLVGYFVGQPSDPPREVVLALETLASRAHNRLQAGVAAVRQPRRAGHLGTFGARSVATTLRHLVALGGSASIGS